MGGACSTNGEKGTSVGCGEARGKEPTRKTKT
jgi:hypothetical protein